MLAVLMPKTLPPATFHPIFTPRKRCIMRHYAPYSRLCNSHPSNATGLSTIALAKVEALATVDQASHAAARL